MLKQLKTTTLTALSIIALSSSFAVSATAQTTSAVRSNVQISQPAHNVSRSGRGHSRKNSDGDKLAGALIGGLAGGIIGSEIAGRGNQTEGAIIGGLLGGALGTVITNDTRRHRGHAYSRRYDPSYGYNNRYSRRSSHYGYDRGYRRGYQYNSYSRPGYSGLRSPYNRHAPYDGRPSHSRKHR